MDKQRVKELRQQKAERQETQEAEDVITKLQSLGLARGDKYADKSAKEVLEAIQDTEMDDQVLEVSPLGEFRETTAGGQVKYQASDKSFALMLLRAHQRRYQGEIKPHYAKVGRLTGIAKETLWLWWQDREEIQQQENRYMSDSWHVIKLTLHEQLLRLSMSLREIDFTQGGIKEIGILLDKIIQNLRLLENKSTKNVEKQETVTTIQMTPPDAAQQGMQPGDTNKEES